MANEPQGTPLAGLAGALRSELLAAQTKAAPGLPLKVGPVTAELTVMTRKEGEVGPARWRAQGMDNRYTQAHKASPSRFW